MPTITMILEPEADGTLHVPVPEEWRQGKVEVVATLKSEEGNSQPLKFGCLKGFWMAPDFDAPLEEFKEYME